MKLAQAMDHGQPVCKIVAGLAVLSSSILEVW